MATSVSQDYFPPCRTTHCIPSVVFVLVDPGAYTGGVDGGTALPFRPLPVTSPSSVFDCLQTAPHRKGGLWHGPALWASACHGPPFGVSLLQDYSPPASLAVQRNCGTRMHHRPFYSTTQCTASIMQHRLPLGYTLQYPHAPSAHSYWKDYSVYHR